MLTPLRYSLLILVLLSAAPLAFADAATPTSEAPAAPKPKMGTPSPLTGDLIEGEIKLPSGYLFFNKAETQKIKTAQHDPISGQERGAMVALSNNDDESRWMTWFTFEDVGYVKDDEKNNIDDAAILENYKEGTAARNEERPNEPQWEVVGWREKPHYNAATHNLEWCMEFKVGGEPLLNHKIKVLGRRGVMNITLACDPKDLDAALLQVRPLLSGYTYKEGGKYEQWTTGDKVAAYGLTALVAGGALAVAAKSGLLAKLGVLLLKFIKPILVGCAVVGGAIIKFAKSIFGRKSE